MGVIARFRHGLNTFSINDGVFVLGRDFQPPGIASDVTMATGTSANAFSGGRPVTETLRDREWTVPFDIRGGSGRQAQEHANRLATWLKLALADSSERVFFEYKPDDAVDYLPTWGQGGWLRFWVKTADVIPGNRYYLVYRYGTMSFAVIRMTIGPAALGVDQLLGAAGGAIQDWRFGGLSTGVFIPGATTNKMTNPVFSHATPLTGWTVMSNLIARENREKRYVYPGATVSVRVSSNHASSNNRIHQDINVGNTNAHTLSAYVMMPDLSPVDATKADLWYAGGTPACSYVHVGGGVYLVHAPITGVASSQAAGLRVKLGVECFLLGMQITETAGVIAPLIWGELLGADWDGTAHASTSTTSGPGQFNLPAASVRNVSHGTAELVVMMPNARSASITGRFFTEDTSGFRLSYGDGLAMVDSGDGVATVFNVPWAAGDVLVLHFTWGDGDRILYVNGVQVGALSFTPIDNGTYLFIGSNSAAAVAPDLQANVVFYACTFYDRTMTAAQVAAQHAQIKPVVDRLGRVDALPWMWSYFTDFIALRRVRNAYFPPSIFNHVVVGGVSGTLPAETVMRIDTPSALGPAESGGLLISRLSVAEFIHPKYFYGELSGTAEATASGGAVERRSIGIAGATYTLQIATSWPLMTALSGKPLYVFCRLKDHGAGNLLMRWYYNLGTSESYIADWKYIASSAAFLMRLGARLVFHDTTRYSRASTFAASTGFFITVRRPTGSAANVDIDFYMIISEPLIKIFSTSTYSGANSALYRSFDHTVIRDVLTGTFGTSEMHVAGSRFEMLPEHLNILISIQGSDSGTPAEALITWEMTYSEFRITPRWALL